MTEWLFETFISPLTETFFQKALIGGSVVAAVCGVVGCLVVLRRMAFLGDALSHAMIAGIGAGYLFMKLLFQAEAHAPGMLLGSLIAAVVTVGLIGFVSRVSRIKEDAAIGIMYTGIFAAGVVLVSIFRNYIHIDLMHFIMGDVLGVTDADMWASACVAALVLSIIVLFFRHFQLTSFDPVMAASIGMSVVAINYVLTVCVSLVVVSAVSMVGVILVVGLLITPAATAYLLTDRLSRMMMFAAVFGITSVIGGLYVSLWIDSAGGGAIMIVCTIQFLIVLAVAPRYGLLAGWFRRRRRVSEHLVEDVLGSVLRGEGSPVTLEAVAKYMECDRRQLERAVKAMAAQNLLTVAENGLTLTEKGEFEAMKIRRAHRLWETYLAHVGTADAELHSRADKLEHLSAEEAVDYLEERLGHPLHDPHGAEIPEDFVDTAPGNIVPISLLRKGRRAIIARIAPKAADMNLKVREAITMGARRDDGKTWVAIRPDGSEALLNHDQAEAVLVRVER
jgi:manganese/iron transport system permease protein/iron/zinc/copper transport system permease protein